MVDCQKHRQGLGCAGRITVIHVRVREVVEEGRRGSERCKHRRVWTRERREGERGGKAASPESKGWTFLTLEGEQSMQTFWKKTCRELYRRKTLNEAQTRETRDQVLDEAWCCIDRRKHRQRCNGRVNVVHVNVGRQWSGKDMTGQQL